MHYNGKTYVVLRVEEIDNMAAPILDGVTVTGPGFRFHARRTNPQLIRMLIHTYSNYWPDNRETRRRIMFAGKTWQNNYLNSDWWTVNVANKQLPRLFGNQLPFVKDLIQKGIDNANSPEDVIVLANTDTCFSETLTARLLNAFLTADCCYAHRRDFKMKITQPLTDEQIVFGSKYPGFDLFAFRVSWWQKHGPDMLDMVIGAEGWDLVLKVLMDSTKPAGKDIELRDCIYHEAHKSHWFKPENRFTLSSQVHNLKLAGHILMKHGFDSPQLRKLLGNDGATKTHGPN